MKYNYLKYCLGVFILFWICSNSFAQSSWQWGQRWGGAHDDAIQKEEILDMEVDYEGNVYISTSVTSDFYIAGIDSAQKTFGEDDLLLISFDCEGNLRWYHKIGHKKRDLSLSFSYDIHVDSNSLYYSGHLNHGNSGPLYFLDSIFIFDNQRTFFAKFDRDGNWLDFKWIWPGGENVTVPNATYKRNDTIWMAIQTQAGQIQGTAVNEGQYICLFDTVFNLLKAVYYGPVNSKMVLNQLVVDHDGSLILLGQARASLEVASTTIHLGGFFVKMDKDGNLIWKENQLGISGNGAFRSIVIEDNFYYITGHVDSDSTFFGNGIDYEGIGNAVYMAELDPSGNLQNIFLPTKIYGGSIGYDIDRYENKTIIAGEYVELEYDTLKMTPNDGLEHLFLVYTDGEEYPENIHIEANGFDSDILHEVEVDANGNIYVAGNMQHNIFFPIDTLSKKGGGQKDLFIAKYGVESCFKQDTITTSISSLDQLGDERSSLSVYPQPASDFTFLTVEDIHPDVLRDVIIELYDTRGILQNMSDSQWEIGQNQVREKIDLTNVPSGLYMVRVTLNQSDGTSRMLTSKLIIN